MPCTQFEGDDQFKRIRHHMIHITYAYISIIELLGKLLCFCPLILTRNMWTLESWVLQTPPSFVFGNWGSQTGDPLISKDKIEGWVGPPLPFTILCYKIHLFFRERKKTKISPFCKIVVFILILCKFISSRKLPCSWKCWPISTY